MAIRKRLSIVLLATLLILISLSIAAYALLGRVVVTTGDGHSPSETELPADNTPPAKNTSTENASQLEADCRALSEQEGTEYQPVTGTLVAADIFPPDGADCIDRAQNQLKPCFDNNRVGIIKIQRSNNSTGGEPVEIVAFTKPVHTTNFDFSFFQTLRPGKMQVSFCGKPPITFFPFIPPDKQKRTPKYEVLSTKYFFLSQPPQGE